MEYLYNGTYYVFTGMSYTPESLGFGLASCSTAASITAKTATLTNYELITNSIVSVKFTYDVPANATLNINSRGAKYIYHRGYQIKANIIKAGDIATFIYNGSYYHLMTIDDINSEIQVVTSETVTESITTTFSNKWFKTIGRTSSVNINNIVYGNGKFVAVGDSGYVCYSTDGVSWTEITTFTAEKIVGITYGSNKFVCVDYQGYTFYSTNGINWTSGGRAYYSTSPYSIYYGNGKFLIGNTSGRTFYSTNGTSWTRGGDVYSTSASVYGFAYGNGKFVALQPTSMCYSTDGINWTHATYETHYDGMDSVCYGNGKFVAIGYRGRGYYSTDGITWTYFLGIDTSDFDSICYDNGKFIAVGQNGTVITSDDGVKWSNITSVSVNGLKAVCYGNGKFVAVGNNNEIVYSDFKKNYSFQTSTTENKNVKDITYQLYNNSKINIKTLKAGLTIITIPDSRITTNSILSFYTSKYGVNPIEVEVNNQSVTLVFTAQTEDMEVGVSVDG